MKTAVWYWNANGWVVREVCFGGGLGKAVGFSSSKKEAAIYEAQQNGYAVFSFLWPQIKEPLEPEPRP